MAKLNIPAGNELVTLIFNKEEYNSPKKIKQWMHLWGLPLPNKNNILEEENNYKVRVGYSSGLKIGTFRVLKLNDNIKAVVAKNLEENPMKKKKNSAVRLSNPIHYPKKKSGRPRKKGRPTQAKQHKIFNRGRKPNIVWWILDLFDVKNNRVNILIGQGDKDQARREAQNYVGKHSSGKKIYRVELSGPYYSKPSKDSVRK